MAIRIVEEPAPTPKPATIPGQIMVSQKLESDRSEELTVVYELAQTNDVVFSGDDAGKQASRTERLSRREQPLSHQLSLARSDTGRHPTDRIYIEEYVKRGERILAETSFSVTLTEDDA